MTTIPILDSSFVPFDFTVTVPAGASGVVLGRTGDANVDVEIPECDTSWRLGWWEFTLLGSNEVSAKILSGTTAFTDEIPANGPVKQVAANYFTARPGVGRSDIWFRQSAGNGQCLRVGPATAGDLVITGRAYAFKSAV